MSTENLHPGLTGHLIRAVEAVMDEIRPRLITAAVTGARHERRNSRHEDNFLSEFDMWAHRRYRELVTDFLPSFVYASEEADPAVVGPDPDPELVVLVDPLDTSELAVRALHGYTHLMVYSRSLRRPVAAIIGDIYHHARFYVAERDRAGGERAYLITSDGDRHALRPTRGVALAESLVTNYSMRPTERFRVLAARHAFLDALGAPGTDGNRKGRIGVDFGSVSLCHVAAGFSDASLEIAKGFALWDLAPGHYVLAAAGGTVIDPDGNLLGLDLGFDTLDRIEAAMGRRRRFIAAGDQALAQEIRRTLATP